MNVNKLGHRLVSAAKFVLSFKFVLRTLNVSIKSVYPPIRTWCLGPWTSSRVTFGPTPKNENENNCQPPRKDGRLLKRGPACLQPGMRQCQQNPRVAGGQQSVRPAAAGGRHPGSPNRALTAWERRGYGAESADYTLCWRSSSRLTPVSLGPLRLRAGRLERLAKCRLPHPRGFEQQLPRVGEVVDRYCEPLGLHSPRRLLKKPFDIPPV